MEKLRIILFKHYTWKQMWWGFLTTVAVYSVIAMVYLAKQSGKLDIVSLIILTLMLNDTFYVAGQNARRRNRWGEDRRLFRVLFSFLIIFFRIVPMPLKIFGIIIPNSLILIESPFIALGMFLIIAAIINGSDMFKKQN